MAPNLWRPHAAMALAQLFFGGYQVIAKVALNDGVNQLVFCVFRSLIALAVIAPVAYLREKRQRPPLNRRVVLTFCILGFTGMFVNQVLFVVGLGYTNPAHAAAFTPSIPVFTFIFAFVMGTETLKLQKLEGKTKLGGTLLCIGGAVLMAVFRGPAILGHNELDIAKPGKITGQNLHDTTVSLMPIFLESGIDKWHLGMLCLIGNSIFSAAYLAIQAPLLAEYPASISVTAYSYFFASVFMVVTALTVIKDSTDWKLTQSDVLAVCYAGVIASALNYGIKSWSNKILGPTVISLYFPLQPIASAFLSRIFLGSPIYLSSILGGLLIAAGLYLVTWASYVERLQTRNENHGTPPASEPLLNHGS